MLPWTGSSSPAATRPRPAQTTVVEVYPRFASVDIRNCVFVDNTTLNGGAGVHSYDSDIDISSYLFTNNHVLGTSGSGGAGLCLTYISHIYLSDSVFVGNRVADRTSGTNGGGGIHVHWYAVLTLSNVIFAGNHGGVGGMGGAMYNRFALFNACNTTFVGNFASSGGTSTRTTTACCGATARGSTALSPLSTPTSKGVTPGRETSHWARCSPAIRSIAKEAGIRLQYSTRPRFSPR